MKSQEQTELLNCRNGKPLDEIDTQLFKDRAEKFLQFTTPQVGDFVIFPENIVRRISHDWSDSVQTSDGGRFYLKSNGCMDFSGSLYRSISKDALTLTDEKNQGSCWFFSHNQWKAHNGVDVKIACRVWQSSVPAPEF